MAYRITNNMMTNTYLSNLHGNLGRLTQLQRQMSTGKLYDRPSQNPADVVRDLSLTTTIYENEQYIRNMDDAVTWLKNTDQSLNHVDGVVQRIRELAIYAGNGALDETDVNAIATEIDQLRDELVMAANYSVEGRHLFAGLATGTTPFVKDSEGNVLYQGNLGNVQFEMERSFVGRVSLNGRDVFPQEFSRNALRSVEVPTDFQWQGRNEIIQIQVGDRSAKVRIPEIWTDDNTNGIQEPQDQNLFRDCGELTSYNLDQVAAILRNSINMGNVNKLVSVEVFKDMNTGTQQLLIKSHTGEPVRITGWQETDYPVAASEGFHTPAATYSDQPVAIFSNATDTAWSASGGSFTFSWKNGDMQNVSFTAAEIATKRAAGVPSDIEALAQIIQEKSPGIFAQANTDAAGHAVLVIQAEDRSDSFRLESITGDMATLFGGPLAGASEISSYKGVATELTAAWGPAAGGETFDVAWGDGKTDTITLAGGDTLQNVSQAINALNDPADTEHQLWSEVRTLEGVDQLFVYSLKADQSFSINVSAGVDTPFATPAPATDVSLGGGVLFRVPEPDHSHIGFASYMGLETALQSMELPADGTVLAKDASSAMHLRLESGNRHAELEVPAAETLTIDQFAERLRGVAGDWLDVVVMTDAEESNSYDLLNRAMENEEVATKKLVIRTKDGSPLALFDKIDATTGSFAANLGISTALYGNATGMAIPEAADLDPQIPGVMELSIGDQSFTVRVSRDDVAAGIETVLDSLQKQVGKDLLGYYLDSDTPSTDNFALYAKNGEALTLRDLSFCDPLFQDYSAGLAMQWGMQSGIRSDAVGNDVTAGANGTIRIESAGRSVDISIQNGESLRDVVRRIGENHSWIHAAYYDSDPDTAGSPARLSLAAADGSPLNVFDVSGTLASTTFTMDTALRGNANITGWTAAAGDELSFRVNGVEHTIDLEQMAGDGPEDLVCLINSRFQGLDVKAQLVEEAPGDQRLVLTSPRGYGITLANVVGVPGLATGDATAFRGSGVTPSSPYSQNVTVRTHSEQTQTDFFGLLEGLKGAVQAEDREGISESLLGDIDQYIDTFLRCRAEVGAVIRRYDTSQERLTQNNTSMEELRSKVADTDLAEAITKFSMAQSVYQSSLSVIAKIVQPTLVDFLR